MFWVVLSNKLAIVFTGYNRRAVSTFQRAGLCTCVCVKKPERWCLENSLVSCCYCSWNFRSSINKTTRLLDIMAADQIPISPSEGKGFLRQWIRCSKGSNQCLSGRQRIHARCPNWNLCVRSFATFTLDLLQRYSKADRSFNVIS